MTKGSHDWLPAVPSSGPPEPEEGPILHDSTGFTDLD
jgi:hypothetical protein